MSQQIRISAKSLGEVARLNFCERCFWTKLHVTKLPFQIFPGIFSSIDSYTKRVVHNYFDTSGSSPAWLSDLGKLSGYYKDSLHYSKFNILDTKTNILLAGTPDDLLIRPDKSFVIVDYKTAKYTAAQDELFEIYQTQLNAYALIAEQLDLKPISALALVYMEPVTADGASKQKQNVRTDGFAMGFAAKVQKVELNVGIIPPLLKKARAIYDLKTPPKGRAECKDCVLVSELLALASKP